MAMAQGMERPSDAEVRKMCEPSHSDKALAYDSTNVLDPTLVPRARDLDGVMLSWGSFEGSVVASLQLLHLVQMSSSNGRRLLCSLCAASSLELKLGLFASGSLQLGGQQTVPRMFETNLRKSSATLPQKPKGRLPPV